MHRFFLKEMLKGKEGGEIASFSTGRIKPLKMSGLYPKKNENPSGVVKTNTN